MHKLGMATLTPNYINSYWATEHGGVVFTRRVAPPDGDPARFLGMEPDTRAYPLPWIAAAVEPAGDEADATHAAHAAASGNPVSRAAARLVGPHAPRAPPFLVAQCS